MIQRILSLIGYPTTDLRRVAKRLAASYTHRYGEGYVLDEQATKSALRTEYMGWAQRYGLPPESQMQVADMAWKEIAKYMPVQVGERFEMYS